MTKVLSVFRKVKHRLMAWRFKKDVDRVIKMSKKTH